jgi:hypothetical protein
MLGDCLARHVQPLAKVAERLAILPVQPVQQLPTACVCQSAKYGVVIHLHYTQPFSCLYMRNRLAACQVKNRRREPIMRAAYAQCF